jgi:hypothetical protein
MGLILAAVALLTSLAAAVALVRRSRRRAAALEAEILAALYEQARSRPGLSITVEPAVILAGNGGSRVALPRRRLTEAARKGHGAPALAAAACDLLAEQPRPLPSSFSLKIHGPRVRARLATAAALALRPREPRPAQKWLEDLQLAVTYCVGDHFLTEDHLREQGIDTRDLHGIALAVQRQEFDEELPRRALASGAEKPRPEILRSKDGSAGALLLTLADALRPGEALAARLAGPDWLGLAPIAFSWPASADTPETPPTHPAIDLRIEPGGYRIL